VSQEGFLSQVKRLIVGAPIPSHLAHHERFSKVTGLAVLSSDPLSSVAYATEEILRVLTVGGVAALSLVTPIGAVIAAMLAIVVFSYRQTIYAYPNGGGAYIVAKDNLGRLPSLIAASALLIDYVLTVAVSIAAGVAAITSAIPAWHLSTVEVSLAFVAILMIGNLRGVRESGRLFAAPTYFFIVSILAMLVVGAWRYVTGSLEPAPMPAAPLPLGSGGVGVLGMFAILTAFSNGCTAMTGVEAVSNGVPAFRPPESRNAASTLVTMVVLSITMFIGITLLAHAYGNHPERNRDRRVPDRPRDLRKREPVLLRRAGGDDADSGARREYGLRRLPSTRLDRRPRSVPASPVHEPGRPSRLFQRHRHSECSRGCVAVRLWG